MHFPSRYSCLICVLPTNILFLFAPCNCLSSPTTRCVCPSAPMNHLGLSHLPKKSYLKSPSETRDLSGNVLLVSWRRLLGTHHQLISEMCKHYLSSNLTSKPSCSTRLSRRYSTPDYRLCICICFVRFKMWRDVCGKGGWESA